MTQHPSADASTTEGLPVAPSMGATLIAADVSHHRSVLSRRELLVCAMAVGLGVLAGFVAQALKLLIGLITNLSFFGRWDTSFSSPAGNHLGIWVVIVPVAGAILVGFIARYGSAAIRGHGIPEAMEQVLTNRSVIPARITLLKPLSAAISIGTGGPFGAEGPIIATGGALGSLLGQLLKTSAAERKTLLAAGAAAGMAATFGSPVSAVILAVELLLFEFRPGSLLPVAFASATATGMRVLFEGAGPVFAMSHLGNTSDRAMVIYVVIGALIGVCSVGVTRSVYWIEDLFDRLPIHWMWWPAIGAMAVGVVGYFAPRTLGVGYNNITDIISNKLTLSAIAFLAAMKFISWSISLGSGTSGGTLAPLFTFGGGIGAILGMWATRLMPAWGTDVRVAALVGMAAMFAGASRALLASVVFAFETTMEPQAVLPLLAGCAAAYLVSCLLMRQTIMTEKIARRGVKVPVDYTADILHRVHVSDVATKAVVPLAADRTLGDVRRWIQNGDSTAKHQGYPVVDEFGSLLGVVTRRDLQDAKVLDSAAVRDLLKRPPVVVYEDVSLRDAVNHMLRHDIGRLPVVSREISGRLVGILTRSDVFTAYRHEIEHHQVE